MDTGFAKSVFVVICLSASNISMVFSSPGSSSDLLWLPVVCRLSVNFSHFHLLLQNNMAKNTLTILINLLQNKRANINKPWVRGIQVLCTLYKEHLILSQQWIWYNHYDNFAQMHLMIATVSEVSDVADGTLVDFLAHLSPRFKWAFLIACRPSVHKLFTF